LNVVAHELNTPLASLKGRTQLLVRRLKGRGAHAPELLAAMADELAFDVRRMERLVKDLQDAARLETHQIELHMSRCDLRALCQQAVREHMTAGRRFVTVAIPRAAVEVEADPDRIAQVLGNLLSNALKYSPTERPVTLRLRREGRHARVTVEDEGPGIAPEALPHVFERFYRAGGSAAQDGTGVGLGLGLFISHSLIERHGGEMGVESTVGVGSTFWFTLPLPG
jgi:signal transduction histidine kinase